MNKKNPPIVAYDVLKFIFAVWIIIFHVWFFLYGENSWTQAVEFSIYPLFAKFVAPVVNFVGIFLPSLSLYLHGLPWKEKRGKALTFLKFFFLLIAVFAAQQPLFEFVKDPTRLIPTVYLFVLVSYVIAYVTEKRGPRAQGILFVVSLMILSLPQNVWAKFAELFTEPWSRVLFPSVGYGWSLIPWCFAPAATCFYARLKREQSSRKLGISEWALLAAGVLLIVISPPIREPAFGSGFYAFAFSQPSSYFMGHFFIFLFLLNLLSLQGVESYLVKTWAIRLSRLNLVRHFWLCYLLQFDIYNLFRWLKPWIEGIPWAFDSLWIITLILLEIYSGIVLRLFFFVAKKKGWSFSPTAS